MYITVKEAIDILGISQPTVYREIERGNLKSNKGGKRKTEVDIESVYRLRAKREESNKNG